MRSKQQTIGISMFNVSGELDQMLDSIQVKVFNEVSILRKQYDLEWDIAHGHCMELVGDGDWDLWNARRKRAQGKISALNDIESFLKKQRLI
jgi:hypothetical protein